MRLFVRLAFLTAFADFDESSMRFLDCCVSFSWTRWMLSPRSVSRVDTARVFGSLLCLDCGTEFAESVARTVIE